MRWGAFQSIKVALVLAILASIVTVLFISICVENADARADFVKWSNRSARVLEPGDYNVNGTCSNKICSWNGTRGIGNLGIGNSSMSAFTDNSTKDETLYPDYDLQGVVTTRNSPYPNVNCLAGDENSASGKIGKTPGIFSYGKPYPGILSEYPVEAAAVYGKMTGLRMPDGRLIDIGVKSIGYEY